MNSTDSFIQRLIHTFSIIAVAVACVAFNGGISIGASNHAGLLPVVRRILDPGYLPNDFNIGLRLYHHRVFAYLLAGLSGLFNEDFAVLTLHAVGALFVATALWYLCRTLQLPLLGYLALGACLATGSLWAGQGLEENDFIGNPEIQPPLFAHSFALFAAALLMQRRYRLAAFCVGCVVFFHLQIGVIVTLMVLPIYVVQLRSWDWRELVRLAGCYALPASFAFAHLFGMLQRGLLRPAASAMSLADYIEFRHPHHFALMSGAHALWVIAHLALLALVWWWMRQRHHTAATGLRVMLTMSVSLAVLSLVHFADYYLLRQDKFANLQSIRVSPLITVFGACALLLLLDQFKSRARWLQLALIIAAALWGYRVAHLPDTTFDWSISRYADVSDKRGAKRQWIDMCNWIKANGAREVVYLTPPANDGFTVLASRSNVAEFKINPDGALQMHEWFARLNDLTGGKLPHEKGFDNRAPLNQAYGELSAAQFTSLSQKYRAPFAVVPKNAKLPFSVLYQNNSLKLVAIPSP